MEDEFIHDFRVNDRVRFKSKHPESEPTGTIVEIGYCAVRIAWDDGHPVTTVLAQRLPQVEKL